MLISSLIINELGQILAKFCKKSSLFDICVYTDISWSFPLHEYKIWHVYTFKNWRNYVNTTILYQFMIIFVSFLRANFGQKYKQKLNIFTLIWHILGKIQLVPKENQVEFVIFKLYK